MVLRIGPSTAAPPIVPYRTQRASTAALSAFLGKNDAPGTQTANAEIGDPVADSSTINSNSGADQRSPRLR